MKCVGSLDTKVLLHLVVGDAPDLSRAAENIIEQANGFFIVNELVLVEVEQILREHYGLSREKLSEIILGITNHPKIEARHDFIAPALDRYISCPKITFVDCLIFIQSSANFGLPLWTIDCNGLISQVN